MAVVRLRGPLRDLAGGRAAQDVEAATVGELLRALEAAHPPAAGSETATRLPPVLSVSAG